ncbi:MAG: hypothetical protein WCH59_09345 [Chitinophagia bacterium]|jgi:hypothetical protein
MSADAKIRDAIQMLSGIKGESKIQFALGVVESVNVPDRICAVTAISGNESVTFENVQLMASIDDGILLIPSIGSTVIVAYSTFNQPFIALFSGLDKVLLVAGENNASIQIDENGLLLEIADTKLNISNGLMQFNDGSLGGLVKVIELTQKLNNLENKVNSLISVFNSHVHTGVTTGAGASGTTPTTVTGTLTPTQRADIENTKIKQ